jgi:hypothetical protein
VSTAKEAIYDAEIQSLMTQVIAVCMRAKISLVADFYLGDESDRDLHCTTVINGPEFDTPEKHRMVTELIKPRPFMCAFTVRNGGAK